MHAIFVVLMSGDAASGFRLVGRIGAVQLSAQRADIDTEEVCRAGAVASGQRQRVLDDLTLHLREVKRR